MNGKKFFIAFVAAFVFAHCFVASSSAQSASPEAIVDDYAKAWNSHDGKAFERLFTDDVIWVDGQGERTEGRIGKELAEGHTTGWPKETTVTQSAVKVRTLGPDAAVILFHLTLAGQVDGKSMPAVDRAMIFVAVKGSGGWRIAAGQITKPAPRELPLPRGNAPLSELVKKSKGALVASLLEVGEPELGPPGAGNYASKWKVEKVLRGTYPGTVHLSFRVQSIPEESRERPPVVGKKYILITNEVNANQVATILDADEKNLRKVQDLLKDFVEPK